MFTYFDGHDGDMMALSIAGVTSFFHLCCVQRKFLVVLILYKISKRSAL